MQPQFDLNLFAVFEAVYSRLSVTAAARHLNVSQPAISHALRRLRRSFADELFIRSGNALVPTAFARSIIGPVRTSLRNLELAVASATAFDPAAATRRFAIGMRPSTEAQMLDVIYERMRTEAPEAGLASIDFRRGDLGAALANGDLDLAIDVASDASASLISHPLPPDDMAVAGRTGHPLLAGGLDAAAYAASDHIIVSSRPTGPNAVDDALAVLGLERRLAVRCQNLLTAWQIAARSDLLLTVNRSQVARMTPIAELDLVPLPFAIEARPLHLHWHETADRDPANRWLRSLIIAAFGSHQS